MTVGGMGFIPERLLMMMMMMMIVGQNGLRVDPAKIAVVKDWPVPGNITELRQFWGLPIIFGNLFRVIPPWLRLLHLL